MTPERLEEGSVERIGPYEILSELTRSPTGRVFLASAGDRVQALPLSALASANGAPIGIGAGGPALHLAIKEMLLEDESGLTPAEQIARFKREAEIHRSLSHPNIVPAIDAGEDHGRHYLVMHYQAGHSWHSLLEDEHERKELTLSRIVELGVQLCKALHYMHEHGVVHRDIKPSNLLISPVGQLKVTDFGMARRSFGPGITTTKMMLGTLNYMSPEQLLDATSVDGRSDVFAAGVILYKTFTGSLPFSAQNATEVAHNLLYAEPTNPRELNPDLPESLCSKLLKALNKDPDYRYLSAESLGRDLEVELQNPELYVGQGHRYAEARRPAEAITAFQKAIALDEGLSAAWLGLGEAFEAQSQAENAVESYLRVVALDPACVPAYKRLGERYRELGNPQAALKMLQRAWTLDPTDRDVSLSVGRTLAELGHATDAADHFSLLAREHPAWAEVHHARGRLAYQLGRLEEAQESFEAAARLAPCDPEALFNLASLLQERGNLEAAKANYQALVAIAPQDAHARHNLACCLLALVELGAAEAEFKAALALKPQWARTWYLLAHTLDQLGRGASAIEALEECLRREPANMDACLFLGQLYLRHYRPNAAVEAFVHAVETPGPHQALGYLWLAQAYRVKGATDDAIDALHRCLRLAPERELAHRAQDLLRALGARAQTFAFPVQPPPRAARS